MVEPIDPQQSTQLPAEQPTEQPHPEGVRRDANGCWRDARGRLVKGSPGLPNAGKKPGSPYRKFDWDVKAICEQHNYNPVESIIHIAQSTQNLTLRYKCDAELLKYCAPTLRSTETKTETTTQVVFKWAEPDETIPTINADGTPTVTYTPEPVVYEVEDTVIDRVAASQHGDDDTPSG